MRRHERRPRVARRRGPCRASRWARVEAARARRPRCPSPPSVGPPHLPTSRGAHSDRGGGTSRHCRRARFLRPPRNPRSRCCCYNCCYCCSPCGIRAGEPRRLERPRSADPSSSPRTAKRTKAESQPQQRPRNVPSSSPWDPPLHQLCHHRHPDRSSRLFGEEPDGSAATSSSLHPQRLGAPPSRPAKQVGAAGSLPATRPALC
mmetsp:Transcript_5311/g.15795  ORF Transcript_5311/g.15795 Transcript_5311/m.15795 type:complete len:204 (-) Transcript_5311:496-1107(-)